MQENRVMIKPVPIILILTIALASISNCQPNEELAPITQQLSTQITPQPETKPEPKPKSESDPKTESDPEPETKPEPKPKPEPEPEDEQQAERQQQPDSEPPTGIEEQPQIQPRRTIINAKYNHILSTYVDKNGMVDYWNLRKKRIELITLARELDNLHPAEYLSWPDKEKIAFWINAYNAFTLKLIIDNYPIEPLFYMFMYPDNSIRQIKGPWRKHFFNVMGLQYTLREIESEILLQKFEDPRVCFALSYASMGGAFLANKAYQPDKLDKQLDEQIKKFLASPRGMRIDHKKKIIYLSDIFNWSWNKPHFIKKFGSIKRFRERKPHIRAYFNFIIDYIPQENIKYLQSLDYTVNSLKYDWNLNEQSNK